MKMERISNIAFIISLTLILLAGCQSSQTTSESQTMDSLTVTDSLQATTPQPQQQDTTEPAEDNQTGVKDVPSIVVVEGVYDFKQIGPGTSHLAHYEFKNIGSKTLLVTNIQSTCGCSKPTLIVNDKRIPMPMTEPVAFEPGETGQVEVTFTSPVTKGSVTKHLYILSNDPDTPRAELVIKADVIVNIEVSPESIDLKLDQENAGMPDLVVKSTDGQKFSIESVTISNNVMSVPFDREEKATEIVLKPQVDIEKLKQFNTGYIQISPSHPKSGRLLVRYTLKPMFEVTSKLYIIQNVEPGTPIIRENVIRSNYGIPAEIESVASKNGSIEIEDQQQDGDHIKLTIKITPPSQDTNTRNYTTDELNITLKGGYKLSIRCIYRITANYDGQSDTQSVTIKNAATSTTYRLYVYSSSVGNVPISSTTGQGGTTVYSKTVNDGTTVTLTAPATWGGATFTGWTGSTTSSSPTISLTMTSMKYLVANYQ